MAALESADVAHLAAHGRFRADSPLFSSVLLADGPVTVYDLERLCCAPRTVVLASCDAAVSAVRAGDELLGTAAALIGLGVRSVVAPVMPVPDGSTTPFMVALHQRIRAGARPAEALAAARAGQDQAVAAAFICIGCDDAGVTS
jgi:CHAT domain-containing protein